jgi:hypothetical protein
MVPVAGICVLRILTFLLGGQSGAQAFLLRKDGDRLGKMPFGLDRPDNVGLVLFPERVGGRADAEHEQREAAEKAKAEQRALDKAAKAASPAATGKPPAASNLLAVGRAGTAKDVAAMAAELVTASEAPNHVLECLLKGSGQLSRKAGRAIDAALLVLTRTDTMAGANPATLPAAPPAGTLLAALA